MAGLDPGERRTCGGSGVGGFASWLLSDTFSDPNSVIAPDAASRELHARVVCLANAGRRPDDSDAVRAGAATRNPALV